MSHKLAHPLGVLATVLITFGSSAPIASAGLVYAPCTLERLQEVPSLLALRQVPAASPVAECGPIASPGHPGGEVSPDEVIDLATNVVYKEASGALQPVGVGLPMEGYVDVRAVDHYGDCGSTALFGCVGAPPCAGQVCESFRVAVTGCHDVRIRLDYSSNHVVVNGEETPLGPAMTDPHADYSAGFEDYLYPSACWPMGIPLKPGVGGFPDATPSIYVCSQPPCVTSLRNGFQRDPGCWIFNSATQEFQREEWAQARPSEMVVQAVWSSLLIDGVQQGAPVYSVICNGR
jgi:hypothetical protein